MCVFHLHGLDLRGLDDGRLCGLDHAVDLNRLPIGKLNQRHRGAGCRDVACCHGYLRIQRGRESCCLPRADLSKNCVFLHFTFKFIDRKMLE